MAFYGLEKLVNLVEGYQRSFRVAGKNLLLCQIDGETFLIENRCPHMDVALDNADLLTGKKIRCLAHGIEFELGSGNACGPLAGTLEGLTKYALIYEGDKIGVDL